jgi:hypothetical protein
MEQRGPRDAQQVRRLPLVATGMTEHEGDMPAFRGLE